jgi:hypothetical protein
VFNEPIYFADPSGTISVLGIYLVNFNHANNFRREMRATVIGRMAGLGALGTVMAAVSNALLESLSAGSALCVYAGAAVGGFAAGAYAGAGGGSFIGGGLLGLLFNAAGALACVALVAEAAVEPDPPIDV